VRVCVSRSKKHGDSANIVDSKGATEKGWRRAFCTSARPRRQSRAHLVAMCKLKALCVSQLAYHEVPDAV